MRRGSCWKYLYTGSRTRKLGRVPDSPGGLLSQSIVASFSLSHGILASLCRSICSSLATDQLVTHFSWTNSGGNESDVFN